MQLLKKALSALGITVLAFTLAALGVSSEVRAQGRTATIALSSNVATLDPHMTATVTTDVSVISQLYSALVQRGPDLKITGDLASSWTPVDDNTWRFELKPGIVFPDGEPLDAASVKWNFDRVLDPKVGPRIRSGVR